MSRVGVLLAATGWVLQRLPAMVLEEQRPALVNERWPRQAILTVEVARSPKPRVRVRDGQRLLVEIRAPGEGVLIVTKISTDFDQLLSSAVASLPYRHIDDANCG